MRTKDDLRQLQALPLEIKISLTKRRIRDWVQEYGEAGVFVAFSGGKDSTVLLHVVRELYPDIEAVFVNTGLEYPEIQQFVKTVDNVKILRPDMRFDEVIKKYGYPVISKAVAHSVGIAKRNPQGNVAQKVFSADRKGRFAFNRWEYLINAPFMISDKCCDIMKKSPVAKYQKETGKKPILATMTCESSLRFKSWLQHGCNVYDTKNPKSNPMSFWTEQDVLKYIVEYKIPYASVYGDIRQDINGLYHTTGEQRTGCMFCMFGCHLEKEPNRFQRMKTKHPVQYEYCMRPVESNGLGLRNVLDFIGIPVD